MNTPVYKVSRKWQTVQYTAKGRAFIRIHNTRYFLDDCVAYNGTHEGIKWQGVFGLTVYSCYLIQLSDDCEQVRYCYCYS